jgi:hypothetical protein
MSTDPYDRPVDPKLDREPLARATGVDPVAPPDEAPDGVPIDVEPLDGEPTTGPAEGESLASAIDGASRPDRVAIAMLVGIVVLLVICLAFAYAAR